MDRLKNKKSRSSGKFEDKKVKKKKWKTDERNFRLSALCTYTWKTQPIVGCCEPTFSAGLPDDGIVWYQKYNFRYILEGLEMENVGIVSDHLEYFMAIW
jgi:hypothetical protein